MIGLSSAPIEVYMDNQLIVIFKALLESNGKLALCHEGDGLVCTTITSCNNCPLSRARYIKTPERNFPNQLFTVLEKLNG